MNKAEIRRNPDMLYPCMEIPDVTAEPAEGTFYKTLAPEPMTSRSAQSLRCTASLR